jgi:transketolase C-terminal domain/subunit
VEDHLSECGLYSIVARILLEQKVMTDVLPISLRSWFRAGLLNHVLEHERFTGHHIALRILERLDCNGCMPQNMTMPKMFNTYL